MVKTPDPRWQDIPFPGKHEGERFQFYFRQHWIRLLRPFSRCAVSLFAIGVTGYVLLGSLDVDDSTRHVVLVALLFLFLLTNFVFIVYFYRYFLYVIIVTDRRIHRIKKTILAVNDHQSMDLWVLQDMFKSQHGLVQNLLGFGTLIMEAQESQLRIHFIPGIQDKYQTLMRLREQARSLITQVQIANRVQQGPHSADWSSD